MVFFKMYQILKEHFYIISFDLMGKGLSSSDKETPKSTQGWIDYFLKDINTFAEKLNLKQFHILGHSLGGYVMGHFANRFPQKIQHIFLLSPGGVNLENLEYKKRIENRYKKSNWFMKKFADSIKNKIFKEKKSPMDHFVAGMFSGTIIKKFYGLRLGLSESEQKLFHKLFLKIRETKPSSEKCLGYLFNEGPMSDIPLMPILKKLHNKKNICIMFGSMDWMDHKLTTKIIKDNKLEIEIETIQNAGHQLIFQNPTETANNIYYHLFQNQKKDQKINKN